MPNSTTLLFYNVRLAFPDFLTEGALLTQGDRIAAIWISEEPSHLPGNVHRIDCQGLILAPGLIDIHNHGGKTHDFVGANAEGNNVALKFHAEEGVTSL